MSQPATSRRRRALGQHFLSNPDVANRIIASFRPSTGDHVIEIGPGRGVLTDPLLRSGARVTAIEVDLELAVYLRERFGDAPGFTLIQADVLKCDLSAIAAPTARVLANLPYSITGPVMVRLFAASATLTDMTLMLQREVVNRIVAPPGGRIYGSLSMLAQYFTEPRLLMPVSAGSFTPPPAVSSAVVTMPFRRDRELTPAMERLYPSFIRMLFAHRRRTLANNLKAATHLPRAAAEALSDPQGLLARAGIDPARRPETLTRDEALRLFLQMGAEPH